LAETNYRGPNYDDFTFRPPVSLEGEEVPEETWAPDEAFGEELEQLEPLAYLMSNEAWPLLDDYLGIREVKAVEALLVARTPQQVATQQAKIETIREFRRLPSTINQAIDYLTAAINERNDQT
jgi:hypothetical protein